MNINRFKLLWLINDFIRYHTHITYLNSVIIADMLYSLDIYCIFSIISIILSIRRLLQYSLKPSLDYEHVIFFLTCRQRQIEYIIYTLSLIGYIDKQDTVRVVILSMYLLVLMCSVRLIFINHPLEPHFETFQYPKYLSGDCTICMETLIPNEPVHIYRCGHYFHKTCSFGFLYSDIPVLKCPNCRKDIFNQDQ